MSLLFAGILWTLGQTLSAQETAHRRRAVPSLDRRQTARLDTIIGALTTTHIDPVPPETLRAVVRQAAARYAESVTSSEELYETALQEMLARLHDPHTRVVPHERLDPSKRGGVGMMLIAHGRSVTVSGPPFVRLPADLAGIQPGDQIVEVDGESAENWTLGRVYRALQGDVGTRVTVTVRRAGIPEPFTLTLTLTRATHPVTNVAATVGRGLLLQDKIGYIASDGIAGTALFGGHTADLIADQIDSLRELGMRALILDLRRNPGGAGDVASAVSDLFLDEGAKSAPPEAASNSIPSGGSIPVRRSGRTFRSSFW